MHTSFHKPGLRGLASTLALAALAACGGGGGGTPADAARSEPASAAAPAAPTDANATVTADTRATAAACDAPTPMAVPATGTVVGNGTPRSCTLQALAQAVETGGHVTFACGSAPVTIAVTRELRAPQNTMIDGGNLVTLDGGGKNRILVSGNNRSLSVRNLRFINGAAAQTMEGEGIGGAVSGPYLNRIEVIHSTFENNNAGRGGGAVGVGTAGSLVISGSTFKNNGAWYGGAVYSLLSPLTVVNSVFQGNSANTSGKLGDGGAIGTDGASASPNDAEGGEVRICGTQITGNTGRGNGGGAYLWVYPPDKITIDRTTVANNHAEPNGRNNPGTGGGMRVSNGAITIRDSSFLANASDGNGGALYLECAPSCAIRNSTFQGNSAKSYGGAIFGDGHQDSNVTFAGNSAGGHGGALFGKNFTLRNTVFVDNTAGNPWKQALSCSTTGTGDHVVQWQGATANGGGDRCIQNVTAANPVLAAPADNGGPTPTMLPGSGSALLKAGAGCEATDQRGVARDTSRCDIGAVEVR